MMQEEFSGASAGAEDTGLGWLDLAPRAGGLARQADAVTAVVDGEDATLPFGGTEDIMDSRP
jgi:hypothetical protein